MKMTFGCRVKVTRTKPAKCREQLGTMVVVIIWMDDFTCKFGGNY